MQRLYSSSQNICSDKIIITALEQVHYLKDVLRLKVKEGIVIFDEQGNEYAAVVEQISGEAAVFKIKEKHHPVSGTSIKLTVACAIPKKSQMDDIIDKLTQLGVDRIIPLETERVVVRLDKNKKVLKLKRWEKIALSAAQQSQRNNLPVIEPVQNIKEVLAQGSAYDLKLIPTLSGKRKALAEILRGAKPKNILVLIGPEGDFTPSEVELAKKVGCLPVSLGKLVLRVETAALAVASFIIFRGHPSD